jgi:ubiquinone/menaquinone biosynthesis C-methylase UbiE
MTTVDFTSRLDDLAMGFQKSQILFTALGAGVFEKLQEPTHPEIVAQDLEWSARGTRMLLDALVALELVEKQFELYQNAPIATACLVAGGANDLTHILRHKAHGWQRWSRLEEAVRTGAGIDLHERTRTPEELRAFICGMGDIARQSARAILDAVDISPYQHLLDVGGGPGTYSMAFLEANPRLRATIVDLPEVLPIAEEQARKAGLEERMAFQAGDLTCDPFRQGVDLILVSNIIHSYSAETNRDLIRRCHEALAPGGLLLVKDFLMEPDRSGPSYGLIFALHMLLHTDAGDTYTTDQVAEWTRQAGFAPGELIELTPQSRLWLVTKIAPVEVP